MVIDRELTYPSELIDTALANWRKAEDHRRQAEQRALVGKALDEEEPERLRKYAARLMTNLGAMPSPEKAEMPVALREAVARTPDPAPERFEEMSPQLLERVIGEAEEFLSVMFIQRASLVARSVGRIIDRRSRSGFGTGFLIAPGVLMTNEHVLRNRADAEAASVQFRYELDAARNELLGHTFRLEPERLFIAQHDLDFAIVAVTLIAEDGAELDEFGHLPMAGVEGKIRVGQPVNIIQHPLGKRKQVVFRESVLKPLPTEPDSVAHYTGDTQPGSSGSPVFSDQWEVIALHHSGVPDSDENGRWLDVDGNPWDRARDPSGETIRWVANEGIRTSRLVRRMREVMETAGLTHGSEARALLERVLAVGDRAAKQGAFYVPPQAARTPTEAANLLPGIPTTPPFDPILAHTAPANGPGVLMEQPTPYTSGPSTVTPMVTTTTSDMPVSGATGSSFTVPLTITLSLGVAPAAPVRPDHVDTELERRRRPEDYADRKGFDRLFLGDPVDLPRPQNTLRNQVATLLGSDETELRYDHFSVVMHRDRRLAIVAAGNMRVDAPFNARRKNPWSFDPRMDTGFQADNDFYKHNDLDRGHLFRRADGSWGDTASEARRASDDTFHWTNIAPQHFIFNQSGRDEDLSLWGLLEEHIVAETRDGPKRLNIFNGPIFRENDPVHRGLKIPRAYWKVVVSRPEPDRLRAFGFVLDQEDLLIDLPAERFDVGRFGVFQVKLRELETRTGLDFGRLREADVLEQPGVEESFILGRSAVRLRRLSDLVSR